jgi:hypothetical protein
MLSVVMVSVIILSVTAPHPSLIFAGIAIYLVLECSPTRLLFVLSLVLLVNITQEQKCLAVTNALAYNVAELVTAYKVLYLFHCYCDQYKGLHLQIVFQYFMLVFLVTRDSILA